MGEYLVDGEWLPRAEANTRMMYNALMRIVSLEPDSEHSKVMGEIAVDTLGFVGDLSPATAKGRADD